MDAAAMKARTRAFALDVIRLVSRLRRDRSLDVLGRQLLKSGTSIGANYRSACRARSKPDFLSKITIAEEEADETIYWLELLRDAGMIEMRVADPLIKEANELTAILTASGRTTRAGIHR
jgi:four helix bundle protein